MKTLCLMMLMVVLSVALLITFLTDRGRRPFREIFSKWMKRFNEWQMMN
ncbi:hypothetical protein [Chitinophaga agrisoli]|nr:hypothetical protein [Chitinophaga agrisoli]